jgi:hypothetical protein
MDDLQMDGFQVPCDGPIILSITSAALAPKALKPKKLRSSCGILWDFAFYFRFLLMLSSPKNLDQVVGFCEILHFTSVFF